nr:uncharacterized protein LOC112777032 isoform X3 [Arachis hypogaea]
MTSPPSSSPCRPLCLLCQNHQRLPLRRSRRLDGLNLGGELGRNLNFPSILEIDLSNNHIGGPIPFIFAIVNSQTLEEVARLKKGLDQESEIPSPKELGSRSSGANNKEA